MRILAIDGGAAAALEGDALRAEIGAAETAGADLLPARIEAVLAAAGWPLASVELVACGIGPGGFTAIRVAVAAARALALAAGLKIMPVTRFEMVAASLPPGDKPHRIILAAGRAGCYVQDCAGGDALLGVPVFHQGDTVPPADGEVCVVTDELGPAPAGIGRTALGLLAFGRAPVAAKSLVPLYLRPADARADAGASLLARIARDPVSSGG